MPSVTGPAPPTGDAAGAAVAPPGLGGLERYRVTAPPPHDLGDLYLIPGYVSPLEEGHLAAQITAQRAAWVQVRVVM